MDPDRLTGFVYPIKKNGVPVRGRFPLWVNLPPAPAFAKDGSPALDRKGRQKSRDPKTTKVVEATGKKSAERLLATWIAELESHRTIDPDRLKVAELLDRWLEASLRWRPGVERADPPSRARPPTGGNPRLRPGICGAVMSATLESPPGATQGVKPYRIGALPS